MTALRDYVTEIPNFPKKGILFRDITTVLSDKDGFKMAIDGLIDLVKDIDFDYVVGTESRGFIFGAPVAYALNKGRGRPSPNPTIWSTAPPRWRCT